MNATSSASSATLSPATCCLIFNPAARGQRAALLQHQLNSLSSSCTILPTTAPGVARHMAADAVARGFKTVVAAGGDGTINEVINGLAETPETLPHVRLGILPTGTANVFAKDLGLPIHLPDAWRIILNQRERRIDLPYAEFKDRRQTVRRYFVQLGGAGVDSRAIALVDWEQKKRWGFVAYVLAGFQALLEPRATIIVSHGENSARGQLIIVGNGRFYGGRYLFFPAASLDDGLLDVLVFPRVSFAVMFQVGLGWMTDNLHTCAGAISLQCAEFTLSSEEDVEFELDGENVGRLPTRFGLLPKALRVLVP